MIFRCYYQMTYINKVFLFLLLFFIGLTPIKVTFAQTGSNQIVEKLFVIDSLLSLNKLNDVRQGLDNIEPEISETNLGEVILFYCIKGDFLLNLSQLDSCIQYYEMALSINAKSVGRKIGLFQAKAVNDLGIAYYRKGEFEKAKKVHFRSLELYEKYNEPIGGSYNYGNLSIIYKELKQIDSALYYLEEAGRMALQANDSLGVGYHALNHGILLVDNSKPIEGLEKLNAAHQVFHRMGDNNMKYYTIKMMAGAYRSIKDYEKAKSLLLEARAYYKVKNLLSRVGQVDISIAENYFQFKQLDSGYYYVKKGIKNIENTHLKKSLLVAYSLLGRYFVAIGNNDEALMQYEKILEHSHNKYKGMGSNAMLAIGDINFMKGNYATALKYGTQAFELSNGSLSLGGMKDYYSLMYRTHKKRNAYKQSLYYLEKLKEINLKNFNQKRAIEVARIEYDAQLMIEKERIEQEQAKEVQEFQSQLEKEKLLIQALLIVGLLLLVIFFILYRSYQIKKRANLELIRKNSQINELRSSEKEWSEEAIALKERELATITMLSHERNTILEQLDVQVGELSCKVDENVLGDIKMIKKTIKHNLNDDSWQHFTYQFEKVHPKFFITLKTKYEALTQRDHKICAYLRVGMERKEIATVSNMTPEAVKKSLYRIKKKMGLTAKENLREHMMNL